MTNEMFVESTREVATGYFLFTATHGDRTYMERCRFKDIPRDRWDDVRDSLEKAFITRFNEWKAMP